MNIFNLKLPPKYGRFLNTRFEIISLYYHLFFIAFLGYLIRFRDDTVHISYLFIRLLGCYVICYGTIILLFGPRIMNNERVY